MPLVVVGHGAKTALFYRQAGLGAVERLEVVDGRKMIPEEIVQAVVGQSQNMTRPLYRG